jgi:hypothetical protein
MITADFTRYSFPDMEDKDVWQGNILLSPSVPQYKATQ